VDEQAVLVAMVELAGLFVISNSAPWDSYPKRWA
jgi:hypothetical protein